jgi:hypothetical protein
MDEKEIESIFKKEGISTEIPCSKAFELSDTYGVTKKEISVYCRDHSIKIRGCQLGCFP